jgi:translocation and assembly module TamA
VNDTIGIVSFLDNGFAYNSLTPNLKKKLLHGGGFGFRYLTNFGPLRFDVGFPLNRRKFIDKYYQLYFGIGQSF